MRKFAALLVALLLLGGACKSTDANNNATTGTNGGTDSTGSTVVDSRAPGVTDEAVKIGIVYPDFKALGDAVKINHGDYEAAYTAVINDINERGGIHGRKIEPVFAPVNPASSTSTDETCTKLTQDDPVFLATGLFFGESVTCFVNVNQTAVLGGDMTDERVVSPRRPGSPTTSARTRRSMPSTSWSKAGPQREGRRRDDRPGSGRL